MKKKLTVILLVLFFTFGCKTARMEKLPITLDLKIEDFDIGPALTATMPYCSSDLFIFDTVKSKALEGTKWDVLLLERYEFLPGKITVIGRGARLK